MNVQELLRKRSDQLEAVLDLKGVKYALCEAMLEGVSNPVWLEKMGFEAIIAEGEISFQVIDYDYDVDD